MRRPARMIVNALTVVWCVSGFPIHAADPTREEANTPLTSVSKRMFYVFASTPDGLFLAPIVTRRWQRLTTPPEMPLNGMFAKQPLRSPLIFYVATHAGSDRRPRGDHRYGLYLSRDDGATWELVSERDDFGPTLLLADGGLFAVTGDDGMNRGQQILRSPDLGKTWGDITGRTGVLIHDIKPDPDHPGLIRVHGNARHGGVILLQADENSEWKKIRKPERTPGRRPSDEFFSRGMSDSY